MHWGMAGFDDRLYNTTCLFKIETCITLIIMKLVLKITGIGACETKVHNTFSPDPPPPPNKKPKQKEEEVDSAFLDFFQNSCLLTR